MVCPLRTCWNWVLTYPSWSELASLESTWILLTFRIRLLEDFIVRQWEQIDLKHRFLSLLHQSIPLLLEEQQEIPRPRDPLVQRQMGFVTTTVCVVLLQLFGGLTVRAAPAADLLKFIPVPIPGSGTMDYNDIKNHKVGEGYVGAMANMRAVYTNHIDHPTAKTHGFQPKIQSISKVVKRSYKRAYNRAITYGCTQYHGRTMVPQDF